MVIDCEDGVLKTTEALCDDKKVACEKIHCLFHTILLVNIWLLLLVVIFVSCYTYQKKTLLLNKNNHYYLMTLALS